MRVMEKKIPGFVKKLLIIVPVVLVLLILVFNCFDVVPAGFKGVRLTMGAVDNVVVNEGLNFKLPFAQSIVHVDARVKKYTIEGGTSASKDIAVHQTVHNSLSVLLKTVVEILDALCHMDVVSHLSRLVGCRQLHGLI